MTMVFMMVILAVTDGRNEHPALAPLAIGLALTMIHFALDRGDRHLGQPGPLDRGRAVRRHRRDHPALAVHPRPLLGAAWPACVPGLFGHSSEQVPGSGLAFARRRRAVPVAPRTSTRSSGTSSTRLSSPGLRNRRSSGSSRSTPPGSRRRRRGPSSRRSPQPPQPQPPPRSAPAAARHRPGRATTARTARPRSGRLPDRPGVEPSDRTIRSVPPTVVVASTRPVPGA